MPPELLRVIARGLPTVLAFFTKADKDGSGKLSKDEFIKAVRSLGLTQEQAQALFGVFDQNDDGGITLAEILEYAEGAEEPSLPPQLPKRYMSSKESFARLPVEAAFQTKSLAWRLILVVQRKIFARLWHQEALPHYAASNPSKSDGLGEASRFRSTVVLEEERFSFAEFMHHGGPSEEAVPTYCGDSEKLLADRAAALLRILREDTIELQEVSKMHEALHVSLPKPDDVAKNALGRHGNFIKDFAHALDHATVLLEPFVTKERYATLRMEKCGIEGVRFFDAWSKDFMPPLSRKKRIFCARSVLTVVCGLCLLSRLISILLDSASQLPRLRCECEAWVHFEHLLNSSDPSDIVDDHGVTFQGGRLLDRFELMWLGCHDEPWARPMFGASQSIDRTLIVNHTHVRIEVIGCEAQFDQMFIVGGNWVRILPMIVATISMLVCVPFVLYKNVSKAIAKELPLHAPTVVFAVLQIILRLVIQASVLADPVAAWLRDTGNEGWRWKTIGQVVDSVCLLLATTLLLSLESTYLCVPRLKFVQAVLLLVLLLESYVLRSAYTWPAESEPITSSLKQSKQGMLMSLDMSAALLLMQGILSTLLRPRHLAFLSLPCDNKQFLAYIKLLKHKREKLSKRRMLKLHGWHSGENNCAAVKARPLTV